MHEFRRGHRSHVKYRSVMERRAVLIEYFSPLRITSSIFVGVSPSPEVAFGGGVDPAPCNQRCNRLFSIFYFLAGRMGCTIIAVREAASPSHTKQSRELFWMGWDITSKLKIRALTRNCTISLAQDGACCD